MKPLDRKLLIAACFALAALLPASYLLLGEDQATPLRTTDPATRSASSPSVSAERRGDLEPRGAESTPGTADCAEEIAAQQRRFYDEVLTEERFDALMADAQASLSGAADSEFRLFAAMMAEDSATQLRLLADYIETGERSPSLLWQAVNVCLSYRNTHACPAQRWIDLLLAADYENSEAWMAQAVLHYEEGRDAEALDAVRRAAVASSSNDYWLEQIDAAKSGIDAIGGFSENAGWIMAVGISAAQVGGYLGYVDMCKARSAKDIEWAEACLMYGETSARQVRTIQKRAVARSVQANAHLALGNEQRYESLIAERPSRLPESELNRYPDSIANFIEALRTQSEEQAADYIARQNKSRRDSGYQPNCDFAEFE